MSKYDPTDNTYIVHVGPKGEKANVKVGRVSGIAAARRHVDVGFTFPNSRVARGYRWACLSRTQCRVLIEVLKEAVK